MRRVIAIAVVAMLAATGASAEWFDSEEGIKKKLDDNLRDREFMVRTVANLIRMPPQCLAAGAGDGDDDDIAVFVGAYGHDVGTPAKQQFFLKEVQVQIDAANAEYDAASPTLQKSLAQIHCMAAGMYSMKVRDIKRGYRPHS